MKKKLISKKKLQGFKTKERIYKTAMSLFLENGYDNVTVDEIVAKASSSKGGFYGHYKNKASILIECIDSIDKKYIKYYEDVLKKSELDSLSKLKEFAIFIYKTITDHLPSKLYAQLLSHVLISDDDSQILKMTNDRQYYEIFKNIIMFGKEVNEIDESFDTDQIICWLLNIHRGVFFEYCMQGKSPNHLEILEDLVDLVILKIRK